ncbi:MAG: hypothetical protein ABIR30_05110 [Chitinophagaceae bacterium]
MNSDNFEQYKNIKHVQEILTRLGQYSINLRNYGITIQETWDINPKGFHFTCDNTKDFLNALFFNPRFAFATAFFDFKKGCKVFREVSQPDSLHLVINEIPKGQCIIHLDSISITSGRDSVTGNAIYDEDLSVLIRHLKVDRLHK